ncbi:serine/threonine-protein kinase [Actinosynnema sp. NPDC047251]|uniref:non-specific serine/threonine protein kinase n=1 Tax=Saccharothrix espanaensis (strain ATCC 51144 / DSM 44229 / JCM 9112 / NBRC 15066 / NRRL 15764) TaxID=1179773 RepID=K3W418_SACES|nr:serine/threonine-protein kinase [Saccharothrix espanaensis]CCH27357.1 Serine/threonine protein kinase [Saccharothrix espanaensis DSM 44229]
MLTSGQLLAERYRLSKRIAVGGMGEVWEAADTRLDRRVAVKVLKAELSGDAEFLNRFRIEARTTASLNHPGIAAVHDYGETAAVPDGPEDTAYLVMELVEGEPLAAVIARGRLTAERTLDVLEQAGNALQAAHERGLVHRDVKPGNILVTPTGKVKITDFGIAKAADAVPVTHNGMVMGTAHYIAPEQALGHAAEPASDVYALAVCGYECLTGHRPFLSENAVTVAMMHIRDIAPPLPPDVPPGPRALIEATLVKDPRQRYRNGGEFAAAVGAIRAGQPLPAPTGLAMAVGPVPIPQPAPIPPQVPIPQQPMPAPPPQAVSQSMGQPTHPSMPLSNPGSRPGIQPVPPSQVNTPRTGAFGPLPPPPRPPGRNRALLWVMVAVLVAVLLVLGVVILRGLGKDDEGPGGTSQQGTTSAHTSPQDSTDRLPGRPTVTIATADFVDLPADEVAKKLSGYGLEPEVHADQGGAPRDQRRCLVSDVSPSGEVAIGSRVTVTCVPT